MDDLIQHLKDRQDETLTLLHETRDNTIRLMERFDRLHDDQIKAENAVDELDDRVNDLEDWQKEVRAKSGVLRYVLEGTLSAIVAVLSLLAWSFGPWGGHKL